MFDEMKDSPIASDRQRSAAAWLSSPEAAKVAGVSRWTIQRMAAKLGEPYARQIGGRWLVSPALLTVLKSRGAGDGRDGRAA